MDFFQSLRWRSRQPRRSRLPDSTTLASCSYQEAHDLACGLDPQRERERRRAEKAALPVLHRPYTPGGRAGASLAQQPQAAAPAAPPVFFAPAEADSPPAPLSAFSRGEEDRPPDHVLEAAAERDEQVLLASLSSELRAAVARAAQRAREDPLPGAT